MITLEKLMQIRLAYGAGSSKAFEVYRDIAAEKPLGKETAEKLNGITSAKIRKVFDDCKTHGIDIIPIFSENYPECLKNIASPPLLLFVKGNLPDFDNSPAITVVGPRKVSEFGVKAAYSLARRLSNAGFTVVSGAALGADTAALKGALSGAGIPVAVIACGICYDYLPENRGLREDVAKRGAVISEHPPFAPTSKYGFPVRNRIMSALSQSTVVVEAGEKSGALVTARLAAEQGKDVFVIPGNPTLACYKGSNALLRDGATPLLDVSDVLNVYIPKFAEKINLEMAFSNNRTENGEKIIKKSVSTLSNDGKILYNSIVKKKFTADDLTSDKISGDALLSALTELELSGLIKSLPGGFYELV